MEKSRGQHMRWLQTKLALLQILVSRFIVYHDFPATPQEALFTSIDFNQILQ